MAELVRPLRFHIEARRREVLLLLGLCVTSFLAAGVKGAPIGFGMNPIPTQLGLIWSTAIAGAFLLALERPRMVEEWLTPRDMWRWSLARLVVLLVTAVAVVAVVVSLKDPALTPPIVRNVTALAGLALAAGAIRAWLGALVPWAWTLTVLMFGSRPVLSLDPELWKWAFLASTSGEGTALAVLIAGCGAAIWVWRRNTAAYRESAAAF